MLVVDDDVDTRDLNVIALGMYGATVRTAATGAEALEAMRRERFDAIVCDIGLPDTDGYAFMRNVRALPEAEGGATAAVALTGYARDEDRRKAKAAGFTLFVAKPVDTAELARVVAKAVYGSGAGTSG